MRMGEPLNANVGTMYVALSCANASDSHPKCPLEHIDSIQIFQIQIQFKS